MTQRTAAPPGTVDVGKTGSMRGAFIVPNITAQTCTSPILRCGTDDEHGLYHDDLHRYALHAVLLRRRRNFFHYAAGDQQLVEHEWKNASPDCGGNHGDIRRT